MTNTSGAYEIEGRQLVAETARLRVQVLTVGPAQCVPWHHHTQIEDTFFCLDGIVMIQTRAPDGTIELGVGESHTIPAEQPHRVSGGGDGRCRFVIVQGVGEYDYIPEEDSR